MRVLVSDNQAFDVMEVDKISVDKEVTTHIVDSTGVTDVMEDVAVKACIVFEYEPDEYCYVLFDTLEEAKSIVRMAYEAGRVDLTAYSDSTVFSPTNVDADMRVINRYLTHEYF